MECPDHKGRDMDEVYSEVKDCPTCNQPVPAEVIGYHCLVDGKAYDLKGQYVPPPEPEPPAEPAVAAAPAEAPKEEPPVEAPLADEGSSAKGKKK